MDKNQLIKDYIENNPEKNNTEIAKLLISNEIVFYGKSSEWLRKEVAQIRTLKPIAKDSQSGTDTTQEIVKTTHQRVKTLDDLIRVCEIDINEWDIERWVCNKWDMGYKTEAIQENHKITTGADVKELFQVKVWLRRNKPKEDLISLKNEIINEIKNYVPKFPKITYPKLNKLMYEICPFDVHFGKLTWGEETNFDYDIKIAEDSMLKCIAEHISNAKNYKVEKFLFPIGNDFFNSDNKNNTTTGGTPQDEDTRWRKTYKKGRQLIVKCIDMLTQIAPVDVVIIPGNHDLERSFYLGDSLECWYNQSNNVSVNNSPRTRKYYKYGNCLIGLTHGKDEKIADLPTLMAIEQGKDFGECQFREWHLGDKHHSKKIDTISVDEKRGVTTRILRSISPADNWHFNKGYTGSLRSMEGFLWDYEKGLKAQFNATL